MTRRKQITAMVSDQSGTKIADWSGFGLHAISKELNAGPGECVITLPIAFDYDGLDLVIGNDVEVHVADVDTTGAGNFSGFGTKMIYKGYISLIERDIEGTKETVTVHMLGYYTLLGVDLLKNGTQTTLYSNSTSGLTTASASQNAADIGAMVRAVIDRYRSETTSPKIYYVGTSNSTDDIPNTGTTATYAFEQQTYRQALDQLKRMAPAGTYWYCDERGRFTFKATPSSAVHAFTFGVHFSKVHVEHNAESIRNFYLVWNGENGVSQVYKHYQDDASVAIYGRRIQTENDYGIDNENGADLKGAKFLAENKKPAVKVVCRIIDNNGGTGYDIESISPGDTCVFRGFEKEQAFGMSDIFGDNMLITKVTYTPEYVDIEVEVVKSGLQEFQDQQGQEIAQLQAGGLSVPTIYS